ncbi:MAG: tetratricopeptide repeat protein, partial [Nitrospinales bacterium]
MPRFDSRWYNDERSPLKGSSIDPLLAALLKQENQIPPSLMIFATRIILFLFLTFPFDGFNVYAKDLDIFKSSAPFPADSMFPADRLVNLETLPPEKIPEVLRQYLRAEKKLKLKDREKRNLLALAIGFLYFKKGDFSDAVRYFKKRVFGNFVLEDFKLDFQAAALVELAKQQLERKRYFAAIQNLLQSIKLRMKIYHSFPGSPFHQSLPRDLAEAEKLLGDAYYRTFNYKPAWQAYRKALMRSFPGNGEFRLEVYLALARTYEAAKNFQEAADIYTYLLRNFDDSQAKQAGARFAKKYKKPIRKRKIDAEFLLSAYGSKTDRRSGEESTFDSAESTPAASPSFGENKRIRDFYQSLGQGDLVFTFERALAALRDYPGLEATSRIVQKVNGLIVDYLQDHPWIAVIDQITERYPSRTLNALAYELWRNLQPEMAAILYKKILDKYP